MRHLQKENSWKEKAGNGTVKFRFEDFYESFTFETTKQYYINGANSFSLVDSIEENEIFIYLHRQHAQSTLYRHREPAYHVQFNIYEPKHQFFPHNEIKTK